MPPCPESEIPDCLPSDYASRDQTSGAEPLPGTATSDEAYGAEPPHGTATGDEMCAAEPPHAAFIISALPRPAMTLERWLDSTVEPDAGELVEALAKAMVLSGHDVWNVGEDVMPPSAPAKVSEWLEHAPAWPAYRPAREAWLTACVFILSRDAAEWRQDSEKIEETWARECVSRFLRLAGLLHPSAKDAAKLVDATFRELQRLPWPNDRLTASEDPLAGWVRSGLVFSPSAYIATAEVFAVWQNHNPHDVTSLKEFGERLSKAILAWRKSDLETGAVAPVKNISKSCCREYAHGNRPRGWGGLAFSEGEHFRWKTLRL